MSLYMSLYVGKCRCMSVNVAICRYVSLYVVICRYMSLYVGVCPCIGTDFKKISVRAGKDFLIGCWGYKYSREMIHGFG